MAIAASQMRLSVRDVRRIGQRGLPRLLLLVSYTASARGQKRKPIAGVDRAVPRTSFPAKAPRLASNDPFSSPGIPRSKRTPARWSPRLICHAHKCVAASTHHRIRAAQENRNALPPGSNNCSCCKRAAAIAAPRGARNVRLAPVTKRRPRHRPSAPEKRPQVRAAAAPRDPSCGGRRHGHGGF